MQMRNRNKCKMLLALLYKELLLIVRERDKLIYNVLFLVVSFCLIYLILQNYILSDVLTAYGIMLITSVFVIMSSDTFFIEDDYRDGTLEQLLLLPITPIIGLLMKFFIATVKQILLLNAFWLVVWTMLFDKLQPFLSLVISMNYIMFLLYTLAMMFFIRCLSLSIYHNNGAVVSILLIPFIFPQVIFSILSVQDRLYILLSVALSITMIPLLLVCSVFIVRNTIANN